jgi:four helix bundle protein
MQNGANLNFAVRTSCAPPEIRERTFQFALRVVKLCERLDEKPGVGRVLYPQILRAGTSIAANVEEAQAGQSRPDFISKMSIALKEARETHIRLRILSAAGVVPARKLEPLISEADELTRILGAIIVSAKRNAAREGS